MADKDPELEFTINVKAEADEASIDSTVKKVTDRINKETKNAKIKVSAESSGSDNTDVDRVIHNRVKDATKHDALSMLMSEAGGSYDRFSTAAEYHAGRVSPVQTRGTGGLLMHTNAVTSAVEAQIKRENEYTKKHPRSRTMIGEAEQDDILAAAAIHDRFKYTATGKLNPNATKDAAAWARIFDLNGAADILSDPNSRGNKIISAVDFAASQESRFKDMDIEGNWKDKEADVLDAAVKSGEGRWKKSDSAHIVDNFERVNEASQEENENLEDWRDNLKGIIGDLGIIALLMKGMKAVSKFDQWAEQTVKSTAEGLPTRSNIGATSTDLYRMRSASGYLNLDSNAIYDSVSALAERQGEFATTGQGLELFYGSVAQGLEPIIKNMNDPIEAWNQSMDLFLNELTALKKAGDQQGIDKLLNAIQKFMGDEAKTILSRIIDYNFDSQTTNDIKNMGALYDKSFDNPYAWESERAEALNSELNTLRESMQSSFTAIASDWEEIFGVKFKGWWNQFLIDFIAWYRGTEWYKEKVNNYSKINEALLEVMNPTRFTTRDLDAVSGRNNYTVVKSASEAQALYNTLPQNMKDLIQEYASGLDGNLIFDDYNLWNMIMAADKARKSGAPDNAQMSMLRSAYSNAGNISGGFYGWYSRNHLEADADANGSVSRDEMREYLRSNKGAQEAATKEWHQYLRDTAPKFSTSEAARARIKDLRTGNVFGVKGSAENKLYMDTALAGQVSTASRDDPNATMESLLRNPANFKGLFTKTGLSGRFAITDRAKISNEIKDYVAARLGDDDIYTKLTNSEVTQAEIDFVKEMMAALANTTMSEDEKYLAISAIIDKLAASYGIDVGWGDAKNLYQGDGNNDKAKAGDRTAMAQPEITIIVNGVDTNNAQEVAYAVSSELKPAYAAQTDSVV